MDVPKNPLTGSTAKKFPLEQTFEALETIQEDDVLDYKDKEIARLQEQLKKANMVISQLQ